VKDCGCEERRAQLNAIFPGRNVEMAKEDFQAFGELLPSIEDSKKSGARLSRAQWRDIYGIFNRTFNANERPCNCTGKNKSMVEKLQRAYEYTCKP